MANYSTLVAGIVANIRQNDTGAVTGAILQEQLLNMIVSLGAGYQFMGVATPSTDPGTPDPKVFYIAGPGTYTNFGGIVVAEGTLAVLFYDGTWHSTNLDADTSFPILNISQLYPTNGTGSDGTGTGDYFTSANARNIVPLAKRKAGLIIAYKPVGYSSGIIVERAFRSFNANEFWSSDGNWRTLDETTGIVKIDYIVTSALPSGIQPGNIYYFKSGNTRTLRKYINVQYKMDIPLSEKALYIYDGEFYFWSESERDLIRTPIRNDLTEINKRIAIPMLEQGGISQLSGTLVSSLQRVRTLPFVGNFEVKVNDGYGILLVASYNMDGTYYGDLTNTNDPNRTTFCCQANKNRLARIVFCKNDTSQNISPDEDIIKSFVGGSEYGAQIDRNRLGVAMKYRYSGETPTIPTTADALLAGYDEMVAQFPQYVTKTSLGNSRPVTSLNIASLLNMPVILTVNQEISEGTNISINGTHDGEVLAYYYSAYSSARYILVKPNAWVSNIPSSGTIEVGGVEITAYRNPSYRGRYYFNDDTTTYIDIALINSQMVAYGTIIGDVAPSATGVLKDNNGNEVANYSDLTTVQGKGIYVYTIDFSARFRQNYEVGQKRNILILGGVHGYERKAAAGHMYFFQQLLNNWKNDDALAEIRSSCTFTVVPCVNPFGIDHEVNFNARGVDLNRNFPEGFETSPQIYFRWSGPEALCEPESALINALMQSLLKTTDIAVDYHGEDGYQGSYIVTPSMDYVFADSASRAANTFMTRYYDLPSYLFGWKNGSTVIYTDTPSPIVGSSTYTSASSKSQNTVQNVGDESIDVNGVTYTRDESKYVDYTNMFQLVRTQGGMTMLQASALGIRNSSYAEVGSGYFLSSTEKIIASIELFGNYVYALVKWFFF